MKNFLGRTVLFILCQNLKIRNNQLIRSFMTSTNQEVEPTQENVGTERDGTISFLKRNFNALNDPNLNTKRAASTEILNFVQSKKYEIDSILIEQIMQNFGKAILKAMSDNVEKVRENATKLLNFLLSRCQDFTPHLPYIVAILVERTNCNDLEGIQDLPEVMRPAPSQKPHMHVGLAEPVEEIRLEYCETISTVISCCNDDEIRGHINDIINILRALTMDPCGEVQVKACQNISQICRTFTALLLHFSEILARALLLPLVNKKSKVRMAALEALGQVLYCGVWKYNNTIMEALVGFRDPNVVPIHDFFEYSTRINYFAMLIKDAKTNVREFFIRCLGDWLVSLPDRFDHEPRLVPYMVSGLFDSNDEISQAAYENIEEVGLQYEREKEKDLRSIKQFGYESEWTQGGKVTNIKLPKPFTKRPRLGARYFIRSHVRKFLPALYKEVKDWNFENRLEAINLLLYGLIYAEDYVTQFLDKFVVNILYNLDVRTKEDQVIADKTCQIFYYLGVYCPYTSYLPLIKSALKSEISDKEDYPKYALIALTHLLEGFFETVVKEDGLKARKAFIAEIIELLTEDDFLSTVTQDTAPIIEKIMQVMLESLLEKASSDDLEEFYKEQRFKAEQISFLTIRYRLADFEAAVAKKDLEQDYKPELNAVLSENRVVKAWVKFDEIFEDLLLNSFIETFSQQKTSPRLNSTEWKIIYTYFLVNVSLRSTKGSKYDEDLSKTLSLIKEIDLSEYGKAAEILQMNTFIVKMISDCFTDEELTKSQSTFLFHAIDLDCKVHIAIEKSASKFPQLQEKLLLLSKIFFCRNISWMDAAQKLEGRTDPMKEFAGNIAELVHLSLETNLRKQEDLGKEFKKRLTLFKTILTHLGPFIYKKSRYLKTKENKYLVPELLDYLMFLHEKFVNNDAEDVMPTLFEALFMILMTIPDSRTEAYKGEEWITPDYQKFLERNVVLAIDTKDNDTKEKYKAVLKTLSKKTPFNVLDMWEKAVKSQSVARIELISSLKKSIDGL